MLESDHTIERAAYLKAADSLARAAASGSQRTPDLSRLQKHFPPACVNYDT